ncbi:hypothetical protein F0562_010376 [Nyssa sinensis]|uniref:Uncharacterized protein n=1 Tax=Nyssa sinensis TaxID=561372 RepID=A0A5J4ZYQ1_9ASTE|nr:hypothetical protein F0562_010376 [Nyssa sinensis]
MEVKSEKATIHFGAGTKRNHITAHQEALKKEIERLRQVYHQQSLKNNTAATSAPAPSTSANTGCTDKEQLLISGPGDRLPVARFKSIMKGLKSHNTLGKVGSPWQIN